MTEFISDLNAAGKTVVLMDDVPAFPFEASQCQYRKAPIFPWTECNISAQELRVDRAAATEELKSIAKSSSNVVFVPVPEYFCDQESCSMAQGDVTLYQDDNHLNQEGSLYLAQRMLESEEIREVLMGK